MNSWWNERNASFFVRGCRCVCVLLTPTSCRVLQAVQQDEAWAAAEAAPRPLPVRDVLQDDVAALFSHSPFYEKSEVFLPRRQTTVLISPLFWCLFSFVIFSLRGLICQISLPVLFFSSQTRTLWIVRQETFCVWLYRPHSNWENSDGFNAVGRRLMLFGFILK